MTKNKILTLIVVIIFGTGIVQIVRVGIRSLAIKKAEMECRNRLKLIGIALSQYEHGFDTFPYGAIPNEKLRVEERLSWFTNVTPYLDGKSPSLNVDRSKGWHDPQNFDFLNIHYRWFFCPSNPMSDGLSSNVTNYVGISGLGRDAAFLEKTDPKAGVFGYDRTTSLADIKDGTSNTIMVAETNFELGPWAAGGPSTVRGLDSNRKPYIGEHCQFGGLHSDVCPVLFADGSVRIIRESVDPGVLEALSTIAGGEKVGKIESYCAEP